MKRKSLIAVFMLLAAIFLFIACNEPKDGGNKKKAKTTFIWTFQKQIPGWVEFVNETGKTGDYHPENNPNGTTMTSDAQYYGMTLLASQRSTRWFPNEPAPAESGFSDGFIQPNGATAAGKYSLKIENVKGPFKLTLNYTSRNENQRSFPIIYIDGVKKEQGEETNDSTPKTVVYEYEGEEYVTISLGNARDGGSSSAGIRFYEIILYAPGNAGADWGDSTGSGNSNSNDGYDSTDTYLGNYPSNWPKVIAFPGAEGFGRYASGGRGGKVVAVTNLDDAATNPPEGSLRWALAQHPNDPITVVFRISGIINLKSELRVKRDNYTLAGQTSPSGICITGNKVNLGGSNNVIIRHLRFRIGASGGVYESAFGMENATIFIIDHCTFGWSAEENMTVYDNDLSTVQWCIVHEGLYNSGHPKGFRGYGVQWGGKNATYHHNLLAHNDSRSPRFNGARSFGPYPKDNKVLIDFVNNVNFNWGRQGSSYGGDITHVTNTHSANFVNNYWKPGPAFITQSWFVDSHFSAEDGCIPGKISKWWMNGNIMEGNIPFTSDNYAGLSIVRHPAGTDKQLFVAAAAFDIVHPVTTETAAQAYESVLAKAGAFPRDHVDQRIISEVKNPNNITYIGNSGRLGIIDNINNVGGHSTYTNPPAPADTDGDGMPDDWEAGKGLSPSSAADGNLTTLSAPYTNLEVYLNELAANFHP